MTEDEKKVIAKGRYIQAKEIYESMRKVVKEKRKSYEKTLETSLKDFADTKVPERIIMKTYIKASCECLRGFVESGKTKLFNDNSFTIYNAKGYIAFDSHPGEEKEDLLVICGRCGKKATFS